MESFNSKTNNFFPLKRPKCNSKKFYHNKWNVRKEKIHEINKLLKIMYLDAFNKGFF